MGRSRTIAVRWSALERIVGRSNLWGDVPSNFKYDQSSAFVRVEVGSEKFGPSS